MPENSLNILIVDDEAQVGDLLKEQLSGLGYHCYSSLNAASARKVLETQAIDVALLDIWLPDINGVELLKEISLRYPNIVCIMQTAAHDLETAVESMKSGASDYITKPFNLERVAGAIQNSLSRKAGQPGKTQDLEADPAISEIEAISLGVEARQEMLDIHSEKVVQQTLNIARQMSFTEEKIDAWLKHHQESHNSRIRQVSDSISRLVNPDLPES